MKTRAAAAFLSGCVLAAGVVAAEPVAIDHKPVGCIVAGQFPRLNACFTPTSALARARIYFRGSGTPSWYYVDMASDAPCFAGFLPRPKKEIGKIDYYVETVDKSFVENRTPEFSPEVVGTAEECKNRVPAPFVNNATVVVGAAPGASAVPVGFASAGIAGAGGASAGVIAAGVVGGGAAVAGAAVAASGGNESTTTLNPATTTPAPTTPTTSPAATTTTTPATTIPGANRPPNAVFGISPDPATGDSPLAVRITMCGSSDPDGDALQFTFSFGDGASDRGGCRSDHTYVGVAGQRFTATACVTDGRTEHRRCRDFPVLLTGPTPTTTTTLPPTSSTTGNPCTNNQPPTVALSQPAEGEFIQTSPTPISGTGSDPENQIASIEVAVEGPNGTITSIGTSPGPGFSFMWDYCATPHLHSLPPTPWKVKASITDACGLFATQTHNVTTNPLSCGFGGSSAWPGPGMLQWASTLAVPGGTGQVIFNGTAASYPGHGESRSAGEVKRGAENRIEAQLVSAEGAPGTWRFELMPQEAFASGSLRVIAGDAVSITQTAIVFRMKGKAGERVVFAFRGR